VDTPQDRSIKERERISDYMNEHEYADHKPYTGSGCAICGRPRYVHDMARKLRELRAQLAKAQEQLSDREKAQDILVLAVKANGREALVAGQKAEELRAERDKLACTLKLGVEYMEGYPAIIDNSESYWKRARQQEERGKAFLTAAWAALRELEGK
jgi:hypothetical protein